MDIAIAFSGKAGKKGHESWGMPDEPKLSDRLYIRSKREDTGSFRLEIEIRELGGVVYTYYTFMKAQNVAQSVAEDNYINEQHGRGGSFFAMILRVEKGYVLDVFALYDIFESVFNQNIMGTVLTDVDTDGYITYKIDSFSAGNETFKTTEEELGNQVSLLEKKRLPDNLTIKRGTEIKIYGLRDTDLDTINNTLFKDSEVIVSRGYKQEHVIPDTPTIQQPVTTPADSRIEKEKEDERIVTSPTINEKLKKAEANIVNLQSQIDALKSQNANLVQRESEHLRLIEEIRNKHPQRPFSDFYKIIIAVAACIAIVLGLYKIIIPSPSEPSAIVPPNLNEFVLAKADSLFKADSIFKEKLMAITNSSDTPVAKADSIGKKPNWEVSYVKESAYFLGDESGLEIGIVEKGMQLYSNQTESGDLIYFSIKDNENKITLFETYRNMSGGYIRRSKLKKLN